MSLSSKETAPNRPISFQHGVRNNIRILIVDDNLTFLKLFARILRDAGYEVFTASKGRQALRMISKRMPDLVVLDVILPDISGIEICRQVKADPALRDVFVILISGDAISSGQTVDGFAVGADEYLFKPISPNEFLARIATMARLAKTTAALRASEQHYRHLIEILPDAVALVDLQLRLTELNERAVAMLGCASPDELLGKSFFDLIPSEEHERFRENIAAIKPACVGSAEFFFVQRKGQRLPVEMSVAVSTAPSGERLGFIAVARDLSERKRVEEELRRLPQRITEAQEAERLRVVRELHDGVNQVIASAAMRLGRVQDTLAPQNPVACEILARCHKLLVQALEENRRIAHNLRPPDLDELGLSAACRNLCEELRCRSSLVVKCHFTRLDRLLPPEVDLSLFRMVQESLTNVEKHAAAKTVRLQITIKQGAVLLKVQDDGRGFDPIKLMSSKGGRRGIGLSSLRGRAAALGGTCEIFSKPKQGTAITISVPLPVARSGAKPSVEGRPFNSRLIRSNTRQIE